MQQDDPRLPAVMQAISIARSPNEDRRDDEWIRTIRKAAEEFLAAFDAACIAGRM